jgi:hypothetical protein
MELATFLVSLAQLVVDTCTLYCQSWAALPISTLVLWPEASVTVVVLGIICISPTSPLPPRWFMLKLLSCAAVARAIGPGTPNAFASCRMYC